MQVQIPELATIETKAIRGSYPCIEHLEAGNAGAWLQERKDQLLARARNGRSEMNLAKLLTFGATAVGAVCYAVSPLAPIGALVAGIGYVWTVAQDMNESHQFAPLPFVRGDFLEFVSAMGDREAREQYLATSDPLIELMYHLDPMERYEFGMLQSHVHTLSDYLSQVESGKKFYAYRWLLSWFINLRGGFPDKEALANHVATVGNDPKINAPQVAAIKEYQLATADCLVNGLPPTQVSPLPQVRASALPSETPKLVEENSDQSCKTTPPNKEPKPTEKPAARVIVTPTAPNQEPEPVDVIDVAVTPISEAPRATRKQEPRPRIPTPEKLTKLPLKERAIAVIEALSAEGFDIARCTENQITCVAGNQRGGKGTLIGILAILASSLSPETKIHYFTAGDDIYPFQCDRLYSRLSYPDMDGTSADRKVALELFKYLKKLDNSKVGEHDNLILIIDEAVALSDYLNQEQKQWMIRFLLSRTSKKGLQIFVVLHAQNLTAWVGVGNAGGFSSTFKTGASFIGCEATTKKISPLKSIAVATGRYFIANPDEFNRPVEGGEIGTIPEWLKTETNPATGQPDPVRSLLKYFPEIDTSAPAQVQVEAAKNIQIDKPPIVESSSESTSTEVTEISTSEKTEAPESFDTLLDALVTSFKEKGLNKIKRIPSGCNKVRTALKQFEEAKHEGILMLLVERLIKDGRAKLPNNRELEAKIRAGKGSLEISEEFEIV